MYSLLIAQQTLETKCLFYFNNHLSDIFHFLIKDVMISLFFIKNNLTNLFK